MDDTNEALKIWSALKPMIDAEIAEKTTSCVRSKKMNVVSAPSGTTIGVCEPFDTKIYHIPYSSAVSGAKVGDTVWVQWYFNNASTMIAMSFGGGDIGFVAKTGDTMTGPLDRTFSGIDLSTTPSGDKVYSQFRGYDKNGSIISGVNAVHNTSDYSGMRIGARRMVNGSEIANNINLYIGPTGTRTVAVSEKDPWKSALDIDDLEDRVGIIRFLRKTVSANSNAKYTFSTTCAFAIFTTNSAGAGRALFLGYCTSTGSVAVNKVSLDSGGASATTSTGSYYVQVNNGTGNTMYAVMLVLYGTAPT